VPRSGPNPSIARLAGVSWLVVALACSGAEDPASASVEQVVRTMVAAVGRRDPDAIMRHVALSFRGGMRDREANLDFGGAQSIVLEFLLRDSPVSARVDRLRVEEPGQDRVTRASVRVWFAASDRLDDPDFPIPPSAVAYDFDVTLEHREATWQVTNLEYARVSGT